MMIVRSRRAMECSVRNPSTIINYEYRPSYLVNVRISYETARRVSGVNRKAINAGRNTMMTVQLV